MQSWGTGGLLSQEISRALGGHQNGSISSACFWDLVIFSHQLLGFKKSSPEHKDKQRWKEVHKMCLIGSSLAIFLK